ncbi:hypothetical protein [Micromonospora sp. IBHARD004]|uniref:hypothetical protein n=1 Tax=Micromonospora sp. IBHARD004 TaxID=3457764 RepID=UPI00405A2E0A
MIRTRPTAAPSRAARLAVALGAGLLAVTGCTGLADAAGPDGTASPSPSPVLLTRVEKPEKISSWPETRYRSLRDPASKSLGQLKLLLDGDATSAVGTAYESADEKYAAVVSAVAGEVRDPKAALDRLFAGLPRLHDVKPTRPGPMGGEARCGEGDDNGLNADVCAWADEHSIGMIVYLGFPSGGDPDDLFVRDRAKVERQTTSPSPAN